VFCDGFRQGAGKPKSKPGCRGFSSHCEELSSLDFDSLAALNLSGLGSLKALANDGQFTVEMAPSLPSLESANENLV
jgi:hypothetical protein